MTKERECPPGTPFCAGLKANRMKVGQVWGHPPPPLGKVPFIGQSINAGRQYRGCGPCTPKGTQTLPGKV